MMRGTFANIRIRNQIAKGTEGGYTTYWPTKEIMPIYDAAMKYQEVAQVLQSLQVKTTEWVLHVTGLRKVHHFSALKQLSLKAMSVFTVQTLS